MFGASRALEELGSGFLHVMSIADAERVGKIVHDQVEKMGCMSLEVRAYNDR